MFSMRSRSGVLASVMVLVLLSLLLPDVGASQPMPTSVAAELERTDRILERAREQVGTATSSQAGGFLEQALRLQNEARHAYRERAYQRALTLTMKARDLARRSLETAEIDVKAHSSIRDLIESTQGLIQDAAQMLRSHADPQAERLLELGRSQLQLAMEAYRDREYRKAIAMAGSARDLVQRALEQLRTGAADPSSDLQRVLDRTRSALDEVREALRESPDAPKAQRLLDEAESLQDRALSLQRESKPAAAIRLAVQARQLALEALLLLNRSYAAEDVRRAVEIVDQLLSDLALEIEKAGSAEAQNMLDSARQRQSEAHESLQKGKLEMALASARLAEGLLRRAAEAAGLR